MELAEEFRMEFVVPKRHLAETIRPIVLTHFLGHFVPAYRNGIEFIDVVP